MILSELREKLKKFRISSMECAYALLKDDMEKYFDNLKIANTIEQEIIEEFMIKEQIFHNIQGDKRADKPEKR